MKSQLQTALHRLNSPVSVYLGDIASAQVGFASGARDDNGVVQVRMHNLSPEFAFVWDKIIRVPVDGELPEKYQLVKGDIIFNNTNSTELVGKSALFSAFPEPVSFSNHMTRLRVDRTMCEPEYLLAWLRWQWQQGVFAQLCTRWVGQSSIRMDKLQELKIPLPPLAEQKKIVKPLVANLHRAAKMKIAMQAQAEAIAVLPLSILAATFERKKIPHTWRKMNIGKVVDINPPRPNLSVRPLDAQTTFIPMESVNGEIGVVDNPLVRPYAEVRTGYTFFQEGDVLFAKMNSSLRNRKHFIARKTLDGVGFASTEFHVLRPGNEVIAEWLHLCLRQPMVAALAESNYYGSAQQRVSDEFVKELEIPVPPLSEQRIIAQMLEVKMKITTQLSAAAQAQLNAAEALPGAWLRRAFPVS